MVIRYATAHNMVAVISQPHPGALATGAGAPPGGGGDDRRGKKPGRAHQKEDVVLSDSTSEDTRARLEEAEALLRKHRRKRKDAGKPSRTVQKKLRNRATKRERKAKRAQKGARRYTPCSSCVRSLLSNPRGHCHDTQLAGHTRCYECARSNHSYVIAFAVLLIFTNRFLVAAALSLRCSQCPPAISFGSFVVPWTNSTR